MKSFNPAPVTWYYTSIAAHHTFLNCKRAYVLEDVLSWKKSVDPKNSPLPSNTVPTHNRVIHVFSFIVKNVLAYTVEVNTEAIFENFREAVPIRLTLQ